MKETIQRIIDIGILPIITLEEALDAIPIGQALYDGGIPIVVITFRTAHGADSIRLISQAIPEMLVGAGTVFTTEQVDEALDAGAKFFTSPSINPDVVKYCESKGVPIFPGVSTPSNIETALTLGLNLMEYFPAAANGGLHGIRAVSEPYPNVQFIPNGGIDNSNLVEYLNDPKVVAVAGDWFVKDEWIRFKDYEVIEDAARKAVNVMHGFEIDHIAINFPKEENALYAAEEFAELFGYDVKNTADHKGYFVGTYFEAMKPGASGTIGHIAISTHSVERAKAHLEHKGIEFDEESAEYRSNGIMRNISINKEIGGLVVQLIRKDASKGRGELVYSGIHPQSLDLQIEELLDL